MQENSTTTRTAADVVEALFAAGVELRASGGEHVGPCWRCGGADRFHVGAGESASVILGCRRCGADDPAAFYRDTLSFLFPARGARVRKSGKRPIWNRRSWDCIDPDTGEVVKHSRVDRVGGGRDIKWARGAKPKRLIYRAKLTGEGLLVVCEGEPDADAAAALGVDSLGVVCGAPACPDMSALADCVGRDVLLWADHDDQGRLLMRRVSERLSDLCERVRMVDPTRLPGVPDPLPAGWGAADWTPSDSLEIATALDEAALTVDAASTAAGAGVERDEIFALADAVDAADPVGATRGGVALELKRRGRPWAEARALALERVPDPDAAAVDGWPLIWESDAEDVPAVVLPALAWAGRVSLLSGGPGTGKTSAIVQAIAHWQAGKDFIGERCGPDGGVVYMSEMLPAALHGELERWGCPVGADIRARQSATVDAICAAARKYRPALVVVDSVTAAFAASGGGDLWRADSVRSTFQPLADLAGELGAAVLLVHHVRKSDGAARDSGDLLAFADVCATFEARGGAWGNPEPGDRRIVFGKRRWPVTDRNLEWSESTGYTRAAGNLPWPDDDGGGDGGGGEVDEQIRAYLSANPDGASVRGVERAVKGRAAVVRARLQVVGVRGSDRRWRVRPGGESPSGEGGESPRASASASSVSGVSGGRVGTRGHGVSRNVSQSTGHGGDTVGHGVSRVPTGGRTRGTRLAGENRDTVAGPDPDADADAAAGPSLFVAAGSVSPALEAHLAKTCRRCGGAKYGNDPRCWQCDNGRFPGTSPRVRAFCRRFARENDEVSLEQMRARAVAEAEAGRGLSAEESAALALKLRPVTLTAEERRELDEFESLLERRRSASVNGDQARAAGGVG